MTDTIRPGDVRPTDRTHPAGHLPGVRAQARNAATYARLIPVEIAVFAVALIMRFGVLLRAGGLRGNNGYDASVYFAASDALIHGRLPYRDFVLLHPPGLALFLTPFAALTKIMSDESAFVLAGCAFAVLGAINAVLVTRVARRLGFDGRAALIGGLFYACWFGAVGSEYLTKLEPLGNFVFLGAVLAAQAARRARTPGAKRWRLVLAGVGLGCAVSVKIWWIVPVVGVVVWLVCSTRRVRTFLPLLAGMLLAAAVIDLPFFLASPGSMWTAVVSDQLGRQRTRAGLMARIGDLTTVPRLGHVLARSETVPLALVLAVLFALVLKRAWRSRPARPMVVLAVGQLVVVLVAPSWFPYYCDYLAVSFAIVVAGAAGTRAGRRTRLLGWTPTVTAAALTVGVLAFATSVEKPFTGAATLTRAVASDRCVMTDDPLAQIELDTLSRGLAAGCPNWIDVSGPTYGRYRSPTGAARIDNRRWQHAFVRYLRSGDAVILLRRDALSPASHRAVAVDGVLAHAGGHTVYRIVRPPDAG